MQTMETSVAMLADNIIANCDREDISFEKIIYQIREDAKEILATLEQGDV